MVENEAEISEELSGRLSRSGRRDDDDESDFEDLDPELIKAVEHERYFLNPRLMYADIAHVDDKMDAYRMRTGTYSDSQLQYAIGRVSPGLVASPQPQFSSKPAISNLWTCDYQGKLKFSGGLKLVASPFVISQGTADEVVDWSHGKQLWELCKEKYDPLWLKGGHHCDLELFPEYVRHLKKFISTVEKSPSLRKTWGKSVDGFEPPRHSTDCYEASRKSTDHREKPRPSVDHLRDKDHKSSNMEKLDKLKISFEHMEKSRRSVDCLEKSRRKAEKLERARKSVDRLDRIQSG
ncbi:hypothetical protein Taro_041153 [Colocasia esculenta]|uniref:Uncharacterized protein n=1 Tax=Colocasia esculenta TaxID=4460 RepID=A0A843WKS7_COLES|nr:hypothetical protein [Colocasia esculenta]